MTPEGKVKRAVNTLLDQYEHYRFMPVQTGYGKKTLDYLVCVPTWRGVGQFVAIETKAPGKKTTPLQDVHIKDIATAGGRVFVVDGDLDHLNWWLENNAVCRSREAQSPQPAVAPRKQRVHAEAPHKAVSKRRKN